MGRYLRKGALSLGAAILMVFCLTGVGDSQESTLRWPARTQKGVTSAFGDWRPGHVHAGIDVKTWGQVGVPILAVADGCIRQVRVSPFGYGKALYLQLNDGRTAVYGHLDRFTPEIDDLVIDRQLSELAYSVGLWFERDRFPISAGDVIAYSGTTASTAPHLHFELRDTENNPINPLTAGLAIEDTIPPVISYILIRPVGPESRLEGDVRVRRFGVRSAGGRAYRLRGRPEIAGRAAFAVSAYDMMDGVWNRFGPYRLVLEVDGEERFETRYDRFSYDHSGLVVLDRDYRYLVREGARAHALYRQTGNQLTFYGSRGIGEGYLNLSPGVHRFRIIAGDALGNESTLEGDILVNAPPQITWQRNSISGGVVNPAAVSEGRVVDPDGDSVTLTVEMFPLSGMLSAQPLTRAGDPDDDSGPGTDWSALPAGIVSRAGGLFSLNPTALDSLWRTGPLALRVRALDAWGSEAVSDPVLVGVPGEGATPRPIRSSREGPGPAAGTAGRDLLTLEVDRYEDTLILTTRVRDPIPGRTLFTVRQGDLDPVLLRGQPEAPGRWQAVYPLRTARGEVVTVTADWENVLGDRAEASDQRRIVSLPADGGAVFHSGASGFHLTFRPGAVYEDAWFEERGTERAERAHRQELVILSPTSLLGPEDILFRGQGEVTVDLGSLPEGILPRQVGLYTRGESEDAADGEGPRWFYLGGELHGSALQARIGGLGPLAVLADTTCPEIRLLSPRDGGTVRTGRPQIACEVDDNATGFDSERQFVLRLNGTPLIAEYDPPRDRIVYTPRDPLEPGDYFLTIEATDRAGNTARITSRFTVR